MNWFPNRNTAELFNHVILINCNNHRSYLALKINPAQGLKGMLI